MAGGAEAGGHPGRLLEGWRLVGLAVAAIAAACLGAVWWTGGSLDGVRFVTRLTARTSAVLFCLAFSASALHALAPGAWTAWQRRNRRYLGLSFAGSHALHALAIAAYADLYPAMFNAFATPRAYIFGGLGYAFVLAMAATSFDRTAAMLGPRAWRNLHTAGAYYLWLIFLATFSMRALADPAYWPLVALMLAPMAARLAVHMRTKRKRRAG